MIFKRDIEEDNKKERGGWVRVIKRDREGEGGYRQKQRYERVRGRDTRDIVREGKRKREINKKVMGCNIIFQYQPTIKYL